MKKVHAMLISSKLVELKEQIDIGAVEFDQMVMNSTLPKEAADKWKDLLVQPSSPVQQYFASVSEDVLNDDQLLKEKLLWITNLTKLLDNTRLNALSNASKIDGLVDDLYVLAITT